MKYDLYDFDGTIYDGDSSVDFYFFCFKKFPKMRKRIFKSIVYFLKYITCVISVTEFKQEVFSFLNDIDNIDEVLDEFWDKNSHKIKKFYKDKKNHKNDIINSASPTFLIKPICDKYKVKDVIGTDVNKKTGVFNRVNNSKDEKVKVFYEKYKDAIIDKMYSDSLNDSPLLDIAKESYFVKKDKITDYKKHKIGFF